MRRLGVAGVAAVVALTAGACGVQPSGVHVADASPFSVPGKTYAPSASSAGGDVEVTLFLVSKYSGGLRRVTRFVDRKPTGPVDLLQYLSTTSAEDGASELGTSVPPDVELEPTTNAHEYKVLSPVKLGSVALKQMACTFDAYLHEQPPDGLKYSTQFLLPGSPPNGWDDCGQFFRDDTSSDADSGPGTAPATIAVKPSKPGKPSSVPSPTGR